MREPKCGARDNVGTEWEEDGNEEEHKGIVSHACETEVPLDMQEQGFLWPQIMEDIRIYKNLFS